MEDWRLRPPSIKARWFEARPTTARPKFGIACNQELAN